MLSKVTLKRTIPQYKTIFVEHEKDIDVRAVGRLALEQCTGNGYSAREGERVRRYVDDVSPVTKEDL